LRSAKRDNLSFHLSLKLSVVNITPFNVSPFADVQVIHFPHRVTFAYRNCSWEAMGPQ